MTTLHTLTADTPGLPCRTTDPELWFSKNSTDRAHAIALCKTCPIRQACAQYALDHRDVSGIWGGTTLADRRHFWTGERCRLDEQGRIRLECGSERSYRSHFSYREQPCEECVAAHEAHVEAERRAQLEAEHGLGGSARGYFIHRRLGEAACDDCRVALADERKARRARDCAAGDRARAAWDARKAADAARGPEKPVQPLALTA